MAHRISGIDHVLVAVRDLAEASGLFGRLGFTASPRGGHAEWGTANHCLMFGQDYIELIAPNGDGPGARRVADYLERRGEGLMGMALGSRDAAASSDSLRRAGIEASEPSALSRSLMAPEGEVTPRFSLVNLPDGTLPGLPAFLCQHLTPDMLRRPDWLVHPNGATGIVSITLLTEEPERLMPAFNHVFGPAASTPTDEMVTVHTGSGLLYLVTPGGFDHLHPDLDIALPVPPAMVVLTVAVRDLAKAGALLKANGIKVHHKGGHLAIDPADAAGVGLEFVERT